MSFAKFHISQVRGGEKSQIFNKTYLRSEFCQNFKSRMSVVVKNLNLKVSTLVKFPCFDKVHMYQIQGGQRSQILSQIFNKTQFFWVLQKFHILQVHCGQKSEIWVKFSTRFDFLSFAKFHTLHVRGMKRSTVSW